MLNYFSHIKNHLGHCNWPRWRVIALGGKQWASVKKTDLSLSLSIHFQSFSLFLNNSLLRHSSARIWLGNRVTQLTLKTAHTQRQFVDMVHILVTSMGNLHLFIPVMKEPVWSEVQQTPMMLYGEYHNCVQLAWRHHTHGYPLGFSGCEAGHMTMRLHAMTVAQRKQAMDLH